MSGKISAKKREFRSDESFLAEHITRGMVVSYLEDRGFTDISEHRKSFGKTEQQIVRATMPTGESAVVHVRLCWRKERKQTGGRQYSAMQLLSTIEDGDWIGSLAAKVRRDRSKGVTHTLILQRENNTIRYAALIPIEQLIPIWEAQRDASDALIAGGKLEGKSKNHAMNGSSPTLWLNDSLAPSIGEVLWRWPGVVNLQLLDVVSVSANDDTWDDCAGFEYSQIGSDGASRVQVLRSKVKRDRRVREQVIKRSGGSCERSGCEE